MKEAMGHYDIMTFSLTNIKPFIEPTIEGTATAQIPTH
jgi:hypothetical protein